MSGHELPLVLASSSPRRRLLLELLSVPFTVSPADVDETPLPGEHPLAMTERLARIKALWVLEHATTPCRVLGGDTTVAIDGQVLGKPGSPLEAEAMLQRLSGRTHSVYSAVALAQPGACRQLVSETRVTFRELAADTIAAYCATDDPYDKAGGYGIQGEAGSFVCSLEGSYSGVVGLPLWHTHQLLMNIQPLSAG